MSSEVFRRVGRGGAGNFYSKQDVQEADKVSKEDIEAQTADPLTLTRTTTAGTTSGQPGPEPSYTRAGRGGAGNFMFPSPATDSNGTAPDAAVAAAKQTEEAAAAADRLQVTDAVAASLATRAKTGGLSGRGGAGNWATGVDSTEIREREQLEREKAAELSRKALEDVELGLAVPQRAYTRRN